MTIAQTTMHELTTQRAPGPRRRCAHLWSLSLISIVSGSSCCTQALWQAAQRQGPRAGFEVTTLPIEDAQVSRAADGAVVLITDHTPKLRSTTEAHAFFALVRRGALASGHPSTVRFELRASTREVLGSITTAFESELTGRIEGAVRDVPWLTVDSESPPTRNPADEKALARLFSTRSAALGLAQTNPPPTPIGWTRNGKRATRPALDVRPPNLDTLQSYELWAVTNPSPPTVTEFGLSPSEPSRHLLIRGDAVWIAATTEASLTSDGTSVSWRCVEQWEPTDPAAPTHPTETFAITAPQRTFTRTTPIDRPDPFLNAISAAALTPVAVGLDLALAAGGVWLWLWLEFHDDSK